MQPRSAYAMVISLLIAACSPSTTQQLPTLIPSATPPPPTETPAPTDTPSGPTATAPYVPQAIADDPSQQVYLRVIHAAPDTPAIDVYVELLAIATNLNIAQNTEPSGIVAGDYVLRVVPAGNAPTDNPLLEQTISPEGGQSLMLILNGSPDNLTLSTFPEPNEPLPSGQSRLTAINGVGGGAAVAVFEGNTELISPVNPGQVSTPITLSSGRTTLTFQSSGNSLLSHLIDLREQHNHTLVLVGRADNPDSLAVVSFEARAPGRAAIRFVNTSAQLGPVEVYLNGEVFVSDAAFGRPSERVDTIAQVYQLEIYAAGVDRTQIEPLIRSQLVANPDDVITMILVGPPEDLRIVEYREDASATAPGETRIAFLNTLPNLPTVALDVARGQIEGITTLNYAQPPVEVPTLADEYTFYWNNDSGDLVEVAENLQLEAGRSYLYLFTGRLDNAPIILSNNVGIDEELPSTLFSTDEDSTEEVSFTPIELRVVNAASGLDFPIDFMLDNTLFTAGLAYQQGSELVEIGEGDHTIDVTMPETTNVLATTSAFLDTGRYSVFASGFSAESVQVLLVPDYPLIFDGQSPHLRLVNLSISNSDARFGLAYSAAADSTVSNPDGMSTEMEDLRRSIPFGLQRLVDNIAGQNFSGSILMPIGAFDIHIVDSTQNALAATIPNFSMEAGAHYDVVAYQESGSPRVRAFMVEYPSRSGS